MTVTRFAPSPTGYLHVGGARTALFAWLEAKKNNGTFILRIEDTDQKRNTPTATDQLIKDLKWLGLDWQEGPDIGGPNGPYKQSERLDIYQKYIDQLLADDKAYWAFNTPEELDAMRALAQKEKRDFIYPRPLTFPSPDEVKAMLDSGQKGVIRFALPDEVITVVDTVRGNVTFPLNTMSDLIIQKSDGFPTFHLAVVIDDALMGVTHVIRGQEHLMNTPGHIALQQALGFDTPKYSHISVTVSPGGGKLSKRERSKTLLAHIKKTDDIDLNALATAGNLSRALLDNYISGESTPDQPEITAMANVLGVDLPEINVTDFVKNGYLPEAMINFVALLGWNPGDNREVMPLNELIEAFDISRLVKSNSLFDRQKLSAFNTDHIKMISPEKLHKYMRDYLVANDLPMHQIDDALLSKLLDLCAGARNFDDIVTKCHFMYVKTADIVLDAKAEKKFLRKEGAPQLLKTTRDALATIEPWEAEPIHAMIKKVAEDNNVGMGKVAQPLRICISGSTISPAIHDSLTLLGKAVTLCRIDNVLAYLARD